MDSEAILKQLGEYQAKLFTTSNGEVIPASPDRLSANLLPIRQLLILLVDKVADSETLYRRAKAKLFDEVLQRQENGKPISRSAAADIVDRDVELSELKINTERLRNYMKYTDGLCTSIQSVLRVQAGSAKNDY